MRTIKALSIKEPWATKILLGKKTIETRTWKTSYRGDILLCCSLKPKSRLSGCAFAIAELKEVRIMTKEDEKLACCEIYPKAYSWVLENIREIPLLKIKGQLGLFEIKFKEVQENLE